MRPSTTAISKILNGLTVKASGQKIASTTFTAKDVGSGKATKLLAEGFSICDETYDRDSHLYIHCPTQSMRRTLERILRSKGVTTVNYDYSPASSTLDVGVTYFKGWHWDD